MSQLLAFTPLFCLCVWYVTGSDWTIGNPSFLRECRQMAIGYDSVNDRVLLLGGNGGADSGRNHQLVSFKNDAFIDYGINYVNATVFGWGTYYTQVNNFLYINNGVQHRIIAFNLETNHVTHTITISDKFGRDTSCLTSFTLNNHDFLMIIGGQTIAHGSQLDASEIFNISSSEWVTDLPLLTQNRAAFACAYSSNKVYAIGGTGTVGELNSIEMRRISDMNDITDTQWVYIDPLPVPSLKRHVAIVYDHKILIIGGFVISTPITPNYYLDYIIEIDPAFDTVTPKEDLAYGVADTAAIVVYPFVYAFVGSGAAGNEDDVWQYKTLNPTTSPTALTAIPSFDPTTIPTANPVQIYNNPTTIPTANPVQINPTVSDAGHAVSETVNTGEGLEADGNINDKNDSFVMVIIIVILAIVIPACLTGLAFRVYRQAKKDRKAREDKYRHEQVMSTSNNNTTAELTQPGSVSFIDEGTYTTRNENNEIKNWLLSVHGLTQYTDNFMNNGFTDFEFIQKIKTKNDLIDIGITLPAHQLTILDAIDGLTANDGNTDMNETELEGTNTYAVPSSTQKTGDDDIVAEVNNETNGKDMVDVVNATHEANEEFEVIDENEYVTKGQSHKNTLAIFDR